MLPKPPAGQRPAGLAAQRPAALLGRRPPVSSAGGPPGSPPYHQQPMALLTASDLHKDMAGRPLLQGVSFKLERRERLTIAGRNGAGKTTLLRMLAGETSIDRGRAQRRQGRAHRAARSTPASRRRRRAGRAAISLGDYLLSGCVEELAIEAELGRLEADGCGGDRRGDARPVCPRPGRPRGARRLPLARSRHRHGARPRVRRGDLGRGLDTFSGGQLTRASLARALATRADVLLLDEPTNHLDIESLEWLEQTLVELDAAVVLVAHDRWFLEAVGTAVLELEAGRSRFFAGSWHQWRREQAAREIALGQVHRRPSAPRSSEWNGSSSASATRPRRPNRRSHASRNWPRSSASSAIPRDGRSLEFEFTAPERSGRVIFELLDACIEVGADPPLRLLEHAELWLERGEHVSLVGPNGTGKTTLIDALTGRHELAAGKLSVGHNVQIGYLSQHAEELGVGGQPGQSVVEATQAATGLNQGRARALLGGFLFSGEDAEKPLDGLSGGERRRLSLAILVSSGANVLILDEPTNHLDIESREALEDALRAFEGAVLLVSHDRALLDAVGTRTIAVEERSLRSYVGGWPEYVRVREERRAAGSDGETTARAARPHVPDRAREALQKPPAKVPPGPMVPPAHGAVAARGGRSIRRGRPRTARAPSRRPSARSKRPRPRCAEPRAGAGRSRRLGDTATRPPSPGPPYGRAARRRAAYAELEGSRTELDCSCMEQREDRPQRRDHRR